MHVYLAITMPNLMYAMVSNVASSHQGIQELESHIPSIHYKLNKE